MAVRKTATEISAHDATVREIVARLVTVYHPERIYLFGSAARGDAGPDSDYDFLLIMPDDTPNDLLRAKRAHAALWGLKTSADVVILTRERFETRLHLKSSLPAAVLREGTLLYAA